MQRRPVYFLCFFLLGFLFAGAQKNHFIYIQTENKQSFYIKIDKKLFSSSSSGYVILPKLQDGKYDLTVGFPRSEWAEQGFSVTIEQKDLGFLLKYFKDKGWGFFNLQTLDVMMADKPGAQQKKVMETNAGGDEFAAKLSRVVNDPSINETEKKNTEPASKPKEEVKVIPVVEKETIKSKPAEVSFRTTVRKVSTNNLTDGMEITYTDASNGNQDTVTIFIPADKETDMISKEEKPKEQEKIAVTEEVKPVVKEEIKPEVVKEEVKPVVKEDKKAADEKFLDIEMPKGNAVAQKPEENKTPVADSASVPKNSQLVMVNSNCKGNSTDEDFLKLRKKMAAGKDDDEMVTAAKKAFKSKCYTTGQVKNLSVLFLTDAGRYQFFDAAYPFVSDSRNFSSLENLLTDAYYLNRFKVMINH